MRGKRFGEVQAERRKNFTEIQKNKAQERDRNGRRNAKVRHLAEPAVWFQRKGEDNARCQPATLPDIS